MNTDDKKRGSLIKEFLVKLVLIIIFVLLLVKMVPWPNMDSLNPLKDQIFNANLQTMKDAGILYFTTERLPKEVGDKVTLTLQEMLDKKLIVPFTDKNGKSCDLKASYVSLEKKENEYLMIVNLKCGDEEDHIEVHLGCYSYCTTAICEAKPNYVKNDNKDNTPKPTNKPTNTPTSKPTNKPTPTPTVTPNAIKQCEYKKEIPAEYSEWVIGSEQMKKSNQTIIYGESNTKRVVDLGVRRIAVGTVDPIYQRVYVEHTEMQYYKTLNYKLCNNYTYVADKTNTIYRVLTDWQATDEVKYGFLSDMPYDTLSEKWVLQNVDWESCKENCTSHPVGTYRKYTRKISVVNEYDGITAQCTDIVDKSVDVYIPVPIGENKLVVKTPAQTLYGDIQFYRVDTRKLVKEATTDTKWIDCKSTAPEGYVFTGNTRLVK